MRFIALFLFCVGSLSLYSKSLNISKNYLITYGDMLDLIELNTSIVIDDDDEYLIEATSGHIGYMSIFNTTKNSYTSTGVYKNKKFIPYLFTNKSINDDEKSIKKVYFDHKSKTTKGTVQEFKKEDGVFNIANQRDINVTSGISNDVISLLLSLSYYIDTQKEHTEFKIRAFDVNEEDGFLHMKIPTKREKSLALKLLNTSLSDIIILYVEGSIFGDERGELIVAIGDNGIFQEAILRDVAFFGDIRLRETK